ncbi:hypothetical protein DFH07DRAFT_782287 [Mycena maculata]|uniref:Uncharacterized protein n=1 Tax=Mycena maculata TaxID=230809 RepID=A0AAD7MR11_9AGAR|nr:hypothetical protein DFH07DRAFT_782287 [Mycena maculata]
MGHTQSEKIFGRKPGTSPLARNGLCHMVEFFAAAASSLLSFLERNGTYPEGINDWGTQKEWDTPRVHQLVPESRLMTCGVFSLPCPVSSSLPGRTTPGPSTALIPWSKGQSPPQGLFPTSRDGKTTWTTHSNITSVCGSTYDPEEPQYCAAWSCVHFRIPNHTGARGASQEIPKKGSDQKLEVLEGCNIPKLVDYFFLAGAIRQISSISIDGIYTVLKLILLPTAYHRICEQNIGKKLQARKTWGTRDMRKPVSRLSEQTGLPSHQTGLQADMPGLGFDRHSNPSPSPKKPVCAGASPLAKPKTSLSFHPTSIPVNVPKCAAEKDFLFTR